MRHLKASLIVGLVSSLLVMGLAWANAFKPMDHALLEFLGSGVSKPLLMDTLIGFTFLLYAFGIAWVTIDVVRFSLKIVVVAAAFMQVLSLAWVLGLHQIFFPPFAPALAILISFGIGTLYARSEKGGRKRVLRHLFDERISRQAFYALLNSDTPLNLDGEVREASVLVCAIFNHDELMEGLTAADYVAMNNLFLRVSSSFLVESGACLDECDGESLRVIFGTPLPDPGHAATACKAALELVQRLEVLNFECKMKWHHTFDYRIGVNSGEMIGAAFGSRHLGAFSVSGEAVDFARHLCEGNMVYGSRILIGTGTLALASDVVEVRPLELIQTRDARTKEEIYELIGMKDSLPLEELQLRDYFWKGIILYREHLMDEALECFRAALNPDRKDPPLECYIRRIEQLRAGNPITHWKIPRF
ncbi:MAG: adenylate/guanylate cyclase domain-containing protein [Verrucomicrobiota bacterium]